MTEQRPPAIPGTVHRRLMPGVQKQHARRDQLLLGQRVAVVDDARKAADQIVARVNPALGEKVAQVGREREAGRHGLAGRLVGRVELVHQADIRRPRPEEVPIGLGDAEQLGDDRDRKRFGVVRDEIDLAAAAEVVDQAVDDRLHLRSERLDGPRREGAADETSEPGVIGRFAVQHARVVELVEGGVPSRRLLTTEFGVGGLVKVGPSQDGGRGAGG